MIPYEIDPSLHPAQPMPAQLDDGFSPPPREPASAVASHAPSPAAEEDPALRSKSDF